MSQRSAIPSPLTPGSETEPSKLPPLDCAVVTAAFCC
jgi:hypothetical protein